jgi:hypothetical protein
VLLRNVSRDPEPDMSTAARHERSQVAADQKLEGALS